MFQYDDSAEQVVGDFLMRGSLIRRSTGKPVFGKLTDDPRSRALVGFGPKTLFYLHRLIWILHHGEPAAGLLVDHEDGDAGHNREGNLRLLTPSQNQMNRRRARKGAGVRYIGVCVHGGRFGAFISENSKPIYLGNFGTPEEAAKVRDDAVLAKYGSVARLNRDLFELD